MANTGNTQQQINYGAAANDGQGDPLRTAFIKTDDNFDAIWNTGPVGSNITILNNTIQSNNTNGNIVLRPNGVGAIQANAAILPNAANLRDLGSASQRWRAAYIGSGGLSVDGNVVVTGNLTAANISYTGNVFVGDLQGSVYADDSTIMVDAVDNAMFADQATFGNLSVTDTLLVSSAGNAFNIFDDFLTFPSGASWRSDRISLDEYINSAVDGYITISTFDNSNNEASQIQIEHGIIDINFYNGANVSWRFDDSGNFTLPGNSFAVNYANGEPVTFGSPYGNANVAANLAAFANNPISTTGNVATGPLSVAGNITANNAGNIWQWGNDLMVFPSGASWRSDRFTLDEYISSAVDGYLNFQTYDVASNLATELHMEHGLVQINIYNGNNVTWVFDESGTSIVPGDIIPQSNGTASLGNATNYWSNLWVANNTIYIGGVPLGISAGNVLTVNGEAVLSNDSNSSITTTGNITANYFIGDGSQLTNISVAFGNVIENGDSNVTIATPNGNVTVGANAEIWTFGTDGDLYLPNSGAIIFEDGDGIIGKDGDDLLISWDDEELILRSVNGDVQLEADDDVEVRSGYDFGTGVYGGRWIFNNNGEFQGIPQDTANSSEYDGGYIQFVGNSSGDGGGYTTLQLIPDETVVSGQQYLIIDPTGGGHIHIRAGGTQDNSDAQLFLGGENSYVSVGAGINPPVTITANSQIWTFDVNGDFAAPGDISATGNVTGANLIGSATIYGNVDLVLGNIANASATKTRITSFNANSYIQTGNGTVGSTGNIVFAPYSDSTEKVVINTATGDLTAAGNITATNLPTKFSGSWTVLTGNSTQSFTVDGNHTYQMWVEGNIPNGIIAWNALVTVTNTNVPVLGQQFAWNYEGGGNLLLLTSIPDQIVGTAGTISNAAPAVTNTNVFSFGINNASGNTITVDYGWIRIS